MVEKVLVLGQGGREHAFAHGLSNNPDLKIFVCPGNAGIAREFECITPNANTPAGFLKVAQKINPTLVIVGPEDPLALGIVDLFQENNLPIFGPNKALSKLESSKSFMKSVCEAANIKTAKWAQIKSTTEVDAFFANKAGRYVVKADGLCAGKGVTVCKDVDEAIQVSKKFVDSANPQFGKASSQIVVEEFLPGKEFSVIGISDGDDVLLFSPARDHKRLQDNDEGPNTGGMGVFAPVLEPLEEERFLSRVKEEFFLPALRHLKKTVGPYRGFLYAGLMVHGDDIQLLEFNVRFGDPEAQVLLFGSQIDFYEVIKSVTLEGKLPKHKSNMAKLKPTLAVVLASEGYPTKPLTGYEISGLESLKSTPNTHVFFSGVKNSPNGTLVNASGRVLAVVSSGNSLENARQECYKAVQHIAFKGKHFRLDIGKNL